ncbi:MAG TPA: hypothetical protein VLE43_12525, partial [Candidatus Saccharimonadia bacterium]|nr:hypothetical protein [Candidatus Saccharimonadia bacterium]
MSSKVFGSYIFVPMSNKRHKRIAAPGEWASRNRSYVVTLGLLFAAVGGILWKVQGSWSEQWPVWKWVLLYGSAGLGLVFLVIGLLAGQGTVK